jgi:hypothetical protein
VRRRYREPVAIAFALALIASLSVHLPVYDVLGDLADRIKAEADAARKNRKFEPVEVDFEVPESGKSERARKQVRKERDKPQKQQRIAQVAEPKPQAQATPDQRQPVQPPLSSPQAVQQHSTNPDLEPDNARFIAEQNNRV